MIEHKPDRGDPAAERAEMQQEMTAAAWRYDERMEAVLKRLEANPDDPEMRGVLRMAAALYTDGKAAARRLGRDVTGGNR